MAKGTLRTWLSLGIICVGGLSALGVLTLSADEATGPTDPQTRALASLTAPAAPGSHAVAQHASLVTPQKTCAQDLDADMQPLAVSFAQDSAVIRPQDTPLLSHIATLIMACEDAHLQIAGHADSSGDDATSLNLSWDRADGTLATLVRLGADPARLEAIGYGARHPVAQGSDDGGAANRRVDFRVVRRRN